MQRESEAIVAIGQVLARYVHGNDDLDLEMKLSVFAADAVVTIMGQVYERAALEPLYAGLNAARRQEVAEGRRMRHVIGNVWIDLIDADHAVAVSDFQNVRRGVIEGAGSYRDRLVRRDGRWWIATRSVDMDWVA